MSKFEKLVVWALLILIFYNIKGGDVVRFAASNSVEGGQSITTDFNNWLTGKAKPTPRK